MAQITREITHLPIMICGKIYDRGSAEDALRNADIVLSAKSMLFNPNWVEDVRRGKPLRIYRSEEAQVAYTENPFPDISCTGTQIELKAKGYQTSSI